MPDLRENQRRAILSYLYAQDIDQSGMISWQVLARFMRVPQIAQLASASTAAGGAGSGRSTPVQMVRRAGRVDMQRQACSHTSHAGRHNLFPSDRHRRACAVQLHRRIASPSRGKHLMLSQACKTSKRPKALPPVVLG